MSDFISIDRYKVAAMMQAMPLWLNFLEKYNLLTVKAKNKVIKELEPLAKTTLNLMSSYASDKTLATDLAQWPDSTGILLSC